jgi:hypothetical protein
MTLRLSDIEPRFTCQACGRSAASKEIFPPLCGQQHVDRGDTGHTVLHANAAPVTRSGVRRGATSAKLEAVLVSPGAAFR